MKLVAQAMMSALLMLISGGACAERVFYEMGIAHLSVGFDVKKNETIIRKWYIAAIGPSDLAGDLQEYARYCTKKALMEAAGIPDLPDLPSLPKVPEISLLEAQTPPPAEPERPEQALRD
ncbi:hypothetical protein [Lysobacter panacisoli]|uniref:Uncharacterized protein n=1 Tax=Lysobacter panacisoli TaxID=1255263 RepID=A0ABP9LD21_9GAMM|nr:hypothetical protein [Lysobacter panacisoli]